MRKLLHQFETQVSTLLFHNICTTVRFNVQHMFAPRDTDLLLGATKQRQLVIWQHNKMGAYRAFKKHEDWVESLIVVNTTVNGQHCEEIFSAGADGLVLRWQLDSEQNCDIYQCIVSMSWPSCKTCTV